MGNTKTWSRADLPTPQIPGYEVYPDNDFNRIKCSNFENNFFGLIINTNQK
jgi:hypothetical protein